MLTKFFTSCFSDFYHAFYYSVLILSAIVGIAYHRRTDASFKWICRLLILTFISELIAKLQGITTGHNGIVYDVFTPIEYFIYVNIFTSFLANKKWKNLLFGSAAALLLIDIINVIFFQSAKEVPTNLINIEMVLLVFLSLILFIDIRQKPVYENIVAEGVFWFNSAVLFYYAFSILIWGFYGVMYGMDDPPKLNQHMLLVSSSLLYIIFSFSIVLTCGLSNKLIVKNA